MDEFCENGTQTIPQLTWATITFSANLSEILLTACISPHNLYVYWELRPERSIARSREASGTPVERSEKSAPMSHVQLARDHDLKAGVRTTSFWKCREYPGDADTRWHGLQSVT